MALSINGNPRGAAARIERAHQANLALLAREYREEESRQCESMYCWILDAIGKTAFDQWLDTTPDDNHGFYVACEEKLLQVAGVSHIRSEIHREEREIAQTHI